MKKYSDRQVLVDQIEPGVWLIKLGQSVPDSEAWLHNADVKSDLDEAIAWAANNPPQSSDLDRLEERIEG